MMRAAMTVAARDQALDDDVSYAGATGSSGRDGG